MKIKRIELKDFKRFSHLIIEEIPITAKLIVLVGPNGSGKTSLFEAFNHYYKYNGFGQSGNYKYLSKDNDKEYDFNEWTRAASEIVDISFHNVSFPRKIGNNEIKGHFYFRSAYRNEPDFQINSMKRLEDPGKSIRIDSLIQNDSTVSKNYERLVSNTVSELFNTDNDEKMVRSLREELTGIIASSMERVFADLKFTSVGDPLRNGSFYFSKGIINNFHYRNLSSGEKSAFDLILDVVINSSYFPDAIYCIDEPEAHMHTSLQSKVLGELVRLVPGESQLWISTHSLGMIREAERMEKSEPGSVIFLDFSEKEFDE